MERPGAFKGLKEEMGVYANSFPPSDRSVGMRRSDMHSWGYAKIVSKLVLCCL